MSQEHYTINQQFFQQLCLIIRQSDVHLFGTVLRAIKLTYGTRKSPSSNGHPQNCTLVTSR